MTPYTLDSVVWESEGPSKWVFKVLEGLPPAEIDFCDFNSMKVFSAHLSVLYPDIVTTYDKVEDLEKELEK